MVRRKVFETGLKEKIVCHEVVLGGRAVFRNSLGVVLCCCNETELLTTVGVRRGRGVVAGGYGVSKTIGYHTGETPKLLPETHVTNSLSVLVVRVSGFLPRRPMRMSFARSDADGRDDEKACRL